MQQAEPLKTLKVPRGLHQRVKVEASKEGRSILALVTEALEDRLKKGSRRARRSA